MLQRSTCAYKIDYTNFFSLLATACGHNLLYRENVTGLTWTLWEGYRLPQIQMNFQIVPTQIPVDCFYFSSWRTFTSYNNDLSVF